MNGILGLAIPLFVLIFLGFVAGKVVPGDRQGLIWLNTLIIYFALPALIFTVVSGVPREVLDTFPYVLATTLATYVTFMLMFIVAVTVGRFGINVAAIQASAASYGNVGYLGVPMAAAVFGPEGALPATLILCFDSLLHFTLVPILQAVAQPRAARKALYQALRSIVLDPMLIAIVAGGIFATSGLEIPEIAGRTLGYLAGTAAPAALFAIGVTVARQQLGHVRWEVPVIAIVKLAVAPLVALSILTLLGGFDPLWIAVAVLLAALPTAANVFVMASQFDVYPIGASNCVLVTTLVSFATVPLVIVLLAQGDILAIAATLFG